VKYFISTIAVHFHIYLHIFPMQTMTHIYILLIKLSRLSSIQSFIVWSPIGAADNARDLTDFPAAIWVQDFVLNFLFMCKMYHLYYCLSRNTFNKTRDSNSKRGKRHMYSYILKKILYFYTKYNIHVIHVYYVC